MAVSPIKLYDSGYKSIFDGTINWVSSTICAALLSASYVYSASHTQWSNLKAHHITGVGYTAKNLSNKLITADGASYLNYVSNEVVFADPGTLTARYIVLVACSAASFVDAAKLIGVVDFGAAISSTDAIYKYTPASTGWFRLMRTIAT